MVAYNLSAVQNPNIAQHSYLFNVGLRCYLLILYSNGSWNCLKVLEKLFIKRKKLIFMCLTIGTTLYGIQVFNVGLTCFDQSQLAKIKHASWKKTFKKYLLRQTFNVNQSIWTTLHRIITYSMLAYFIYVLSYLPGKERMFDIYKCLIYTERS